MRRRPLAFLIGPLVPALPFLTLVFLGGFKGAIFLMLYWIFFTLVFAYIPAGLFYFLLASLEKRAPHFICLPSYMLLGACTGLVGDLSVSVLLMESFGFLPIYNFFAGAVAATIIWFMSKPKEQSPHAQTH